MFLETPRGSWIVVKKESLLAEVNGIIFAPESFKIHQDLASNTGIVSESCLCSHFTKYDPVMLVEFLVSMQLCERITSEALQLTNLSAIFLENDSCAKELLFFPALMSHDTQRPLMNTEHKDVNDEQKDVAVIDQPFQFGWCLQSTNQYQYFSPRFLHLLILRLAFNHALPKSQDNLHDRRCTIWSTGTMWSSGYGVNTLVELVDDSQCVILLMSSQEGLQHNMIPDVRRDVITDILSIQQECCPSVQPKEFVIDPSELHYPIDKPSSLVLYDIEAIASSVIDKKPCVTPYTKIKGSFVDKPLMSLLPLEYDRGQDISIFVGRDIEDFKLHKLSKAFSPVDESSAIKQYSEDTDNTDQMNEPNYSDDDPLMKDIIDVFKCLDESILGQAPHPTDVFNLLKVKAYDWDNIGREFGMPFGYRKGLTRESLMSTDESKLENVIMKWVESKCSDVTWNKVIEVLRNLQYSDLMQSAKEIFKRLSEQNPLQAKKIATIHHKRWPTEDMIDEETEVTTITTTTHD